MDYDFIEKDSSNQNLDRCEVFQISYQYQNQTQLFVWESLISAVAHDQTLVYSFKTFAMNRGPIFKRPITKVPGPRI